MSRKAGIKFTVGSSTTNNPVEALSQFQQPARNLKKKIGELTTVYDEIAPVIINRIKGRFNNGTFGDPPFPPIGDMAYKLRHARAGDTSTQDNPALVSTGALRDSIKRRPGPTKGQDGGQREVYVLRIGSSGVPYARDVLNGSTMHVPIFRHLGDPHQEEWFLLNYDAIKDSKVTNDEMYTRKTLSYINWMMEPDMYIEDVPGRDFFQLWPEDEQFIFKKVNEFVNRLPLDHTQDLAQMFG